MRLLGYARVSSDGQSLTAQVSELKAAGCVEIFQEKISGAKSDRKQLVRAIARVDEGNVLIVTRLDRLARSTRDLLNVLVPASARVTTAAQPEVKGLPTGAYLEVCGTEGE